SAAAQPVTAGGSTSTQQQQQYTANAPSETERARTAQSYHVDTSAETMQEQTARAVPAAGSAVPALYNAPAELEYNAREQAGRETEQPSEQRRAEQQSAMQSAFAASQPVTAGGTTATQQQQQYTANAPSETERARTAQQSDYVDTFAETMQEQTVRAVPVTGPAVPTLYNAPAELEYNAREQAGREPEQPSGQRRAEQQSALHSASASTQPVTEGGTAATQQQYTAKTPAEMERAQTARQSDHVDTSAETMQEQTAQAVPVAGSAIPTPYDAPAELEYIAQEQADRETEQPSEQRQVEQQSTLQSVSAAARPVTAGGTTAARQRQQTAGNAAETARAVPLADSVAAHTISPVLRTLAHRDAPHSAFDEQRVMNTASARQSPFVRAPRQPSRELKTGQMGQPALRIPPAVPDQQNPTPWDKGVDLTYTQLLRAPQEAAAEDSGQTSAEHQAEGRFAQEIPAWARAVLQQNGGQLPPAGTQPEPIGSRKSGATDGQISWSASYALPPGMRSSEQGASPSIAGQSPMVFRARNAAEQEQTPRGQELDERTARKMADKVYKIIEERLRKELRRGGR
ncbi:MAG: hypothetical protein IJ617_07710, partial [Oscillospiraceae bacterium]|nr:hypothetical protein [Oscillospiraceae bacterium]